MKKLQRYVKKFFKWLWHGKSASSYVAFVIFAYVMLKFVAFPLFLFTFGLSDVVAVLSGSMHHGGDVISLTYNEWLDFNGFSENVYTQWPFNHGMDVGDVVAIVPGEIQVGDVIVYYHGRDMIIHRVINLTRVDGGTFITTKGDANPDSLPFEYNIPVEFVVGKALFKIPLLGWPRVALYYLTGF